MIKSKLILTIFLSLLFCVNFSYAQNKSVFGIDGGISKAIGDGSEYWNLGFNIGGEWFLKLSDNIYIGARGAYNSWTPDEDELKSQIPAIPGLSVDISGSASIIELSPSLRFITSLGIFGQAGVGYYILDMEAKASATYMGNKVSFSTSQTDNKFGVNFGAGYITGLIGNTKFSVNPMYNIIFTEGESTSYFTVSLGILYGF